MERKSFQRIFVLKDFRSIFVLKNSCFISIPSLRFLFRRVFDFPTAPTKVVHIATKCFTIRSRNGFGWFHMIKKSQKIFQKIFWCEKFWKESIQPQVPLRLPCYDFTSVTHHLVTPNPSFHKKILKIQKTLLTWLDPLGSIQGQIKKGFVFFWKCWVSKLRRQSISMVWRAVCTRLRYIFTAACWSAITSDSIFMVSSCRHQSELRRFFRICSNLHSCSPLWSSL